MTPAVLINSICLSMLMLVVVYCWLFLVNLILLSDDMFVASLLLHDVIVFVSLFFCVYLITRLYMKKESAISVKDEEFMSYERERKREREWQSLVCA